MAITKFIPEVWAATLLSVLQKSLVYASASTVNRNYEGDIAAYGDTVHIVSVADPTITDYNKDTDLTIEVLTDSEQLLTIDQSKAFAFEIDDIDMRQARNGGALMAEAAFRAGFGLRDVADKYVGAKMAAGAGSSLGVVDATTVTNVYDALLVPASVQLDQNNVPADGRWIVLDPATYGKLQLDSRFIKYNEANSDALHNGIVGDAAGFRIFKSNNAFQANRSGITATTHSGTKVIDGAAAGTFSQADVGLSIGGTGVGASNHIVSVTADGTSVTTSVNSSASATVADVALSGGGQYAVAGSQIATSYAEQINKVEAFRPQKRFSDALKGLHLYGAKVVRPEALVVASVKVS
jgi:hypothetical protein